MFQLLRPKRTILKSISHLLEFHSSLQHLPFFLLALFIVKKEHNVKSNFSLHKKLSFKNHR